MSGEIFGGGIIFVIAALLWVAVLVPAWVRRREFRTAERNALRLQRTLRVLAETAEVPYELRVEATAKEALAHEKLLRTAQKRREAERAADLAQARAEQIRSEIRAQHMRRKQLAAQRAQRLRKPIVRRMRATAALTSLTTFTGMLIGVGLLIAGSGATVLSWSAAVFCASIATLLLMAPGRVRAETISAEQLNTPTTTLIDRDTEQLLTATGESKDATAGHAAAQHAAAARIEKAKALARARQELATSAKQQENQPGSILLREARTQVERDRPVQQYQREKSPRLETPSTLQESAHSSRSTNPAGPVPHQQQQPRRAHSTGAPANMSQATRLNQMGLIGDTSVGMPDLDAVLRRRRGVG